ncbi:hypothetical protein ES703_00788 [subsurface metagenome]
MKEHAVIWLAGIALLLAVISLGVAAIAISSIPDIQVGKATVEIPSSGECKAHVFFQAEFPENPTFSARTPVVIATPCFRKTIGGKPLLVYVFEVGFVTRNGFDIWIAGEPGTIEVDWIAIYY